ncbi:hypothetical protein [Saccharopolyspora sp.]|uniref:LGFP repeat-containing protein n=1 Tax=Saccharopolyspora sp. TaxID=33915 RepID=UPI0025FFA2F7|nr:hypothetical protein [Saccharopolyspora sp.]
MNTTRWGTALALLPLAALPLAPATPVALATPDALAAPATAAPPAQAREFTPIEDRYWNDAALRELLGDPVDSEQGDGAVTYRQFQHGWLFHTERTGVAEIHGDIAARYDSAGGYASLGAATSDELIAPDGVGRYNQFTGGTRGEASIYWTPDTGAQGVWGAVRAFWAEKGWEVGYLGYPTTTTEATPDGLGEQNQFVGPDAAGASVYSTERTGTHSVQGAIRDAWIAQGSETGPLGYPVTDELAAPDGVGRYNEFSGEQAGVAYWHPDAGAHWLTGAVLARWDELDRQSGYLGYPTSDPHEVEGGTQVDFQRGYILFDPVTGGVSDGPWS